MLMTRSATYHSWTDRYTSRSRSHLSKQSRLPWCCRCGLSHVWCRSCGRNARWRLRRSSRSRRWRSTKCGRWTTARSPPTTRHYYYFSYGYKKFWRTQNYVRESEKKNGVRLWCKLAFYWLIVTLRFKSFPDLVAGFSSNPISARTKFFTKKVPPTQKTIGEG